MKEQREGRGEVVDRDTPHLGRLIKNVELQKPNPVVLDLILITQPLFLSGRCSLYFNESWLFFGILF